MKERWHTSPVKLGALGRNAEFMLTVNLDDPADVSMIHGLSQGYLYEPDLVWLLLRTLKQGDTALDIGANLGFFSLLMGQLVGVSGQVRAYEPAPNVLPLLEQNVAQNHMRQITVYPTVLWSSRTEIDFFLNADSTGGNAVWDPGTFSANARSREKPAVRRLQARTLDESDFGHNRVKFIKIDVEGAEQDVLLGASRLLSDHKPPYIVAELNPHGMQQLGRSMEAFRNLMHVNGYELFFLHADGSLPALIPDKTQVKFVNNVVVRNVLFSTLDAVAQAWPEATG